MSELASALNKALGIIEFDRNGYVIGANELFLEMMGYTLDEVRDSHHSRFCDPAQVDSAAHKVFWADLLSGRVQSGDFQRFGKNGKMVWLHASYTPVYDSAGKLRRIVKFATDITQSKTVSVEFEALTQAVNRVHAVVEYDLKGHVLQANPNFLQLSGYSFEEIKGKPDSLFCMPDETSLKSLQQMWERLAGGSSESGEFARVSKDGHEHWIQAWYTPILNAAGKPYKVVKFSSDITERKLADKRAQDALLLMSRVARIGTWELDVETCQLTMSEMSRELLGIAPSVSGNLFADVLAKLKHPELLLDAIAAAKASRQGWEFEQELRDEAAEVRQVRWIGIPHPSTQQLTVVGTLQDVGHQPAHGLQRQQRQQDVDLMSDDGQLRLGQSAQEEQGAMATLHSAYRRLLHRG